jgi:small subunit ribosomal protein S5
MKEIKKNEENNEQVVKSVAQAEQILEQEEALKTIPVEEAAAQPAATKGGASSSGGRRRGGDRERKGPPKKSLITDGMIEKVVSINRVSKTTKGGTRLAFSALVVIGDGKGKVGYGLGKAGEVATAIKKSLSAARKNMIFVNRRGTTITHEILGECGSASVLLKPASDGTGVIASGAVRAVCDGAGISNILTKCHRSNNPINVVKATFDGLSRLKIVREN